MGQRHRRGQRRERGDRACARRAASHHVPGGVHLRRHGRPQGDAYVLRGAGDVRVRARARCWVGCCCAAIGHAPAITVWKLMEHPPCMPVLFSAVDTHLLLC